MRNSLLLSCFCLHAIGCGAAAAPDEFGEVQLEVISSAPLSETEVGSVSNAVEIKFINLGTKRSGALQLVIDNESAFAVTDECTDKSLRPGDICVATVEFTPTAVGSFELKADLQDPDAGISVVASLLATAIEPNEWLSMDPSVTLLAQAIASGSRSHEFELTGKTAATTGALSVALANPNAPGFAGDFSISEDDCSGESLAKDETCRIKVTMDPDGVAGFRSIEVIVTSNTIGTVKRTIAGHGGTSVSLAPPADSNYEIYGGGLTCPGNCSGLVTDGAEVTFRVRAKTAQAGVSFNANWSPSCAGGSSNGVKSCKQSMGASLNLSAVVMETFEPPEEQEGPEGPVYQFQSIWTP